MIDTFFTIQGRRKGGGAKRELPALTAAARLILIPASRLGLLLQLPQIAVRQALKALSSFQKLAGSALLHLMSAPLLRF